MLSRSFYSLYQLQFGVSVRDPSCPFVLMRLEVARTLLPELGAMEEGFWWEFMARACRAGFSVGEVPVRHRLRASGATRIYQPAKLPYIGYRHLRALWTICHAPTGRTKP